MRLIAEDGSRSWITLANFAAQLNPEDWQEAGWPSQEGERQVYVHAIPTWVRKLGPTLVLITCHDPASPTQSIRYWGSTWLDADAQQLINILAIRWSVEVLFEDEKDLLGADHYQLMSATAILRFWTLIACLSYFLDQQRATQDALLTWGDARRALQKEHQLNLLLWLEHQLKSGLTVHQIGAQLAL